MSDKKNIVVLTGAGISAESGIQTFRGSDGLWEGHNVMDVASPQGWRKDPAMVLEFYNQRRLAAYNAYPNEGHKQIALHDQDFNISIVTQNVDTLHEEAGSRNILHLHGKIDESRSSVNPNDIYRADPKEGIQIGDRCRRGSQLRPNIVWFGEDVPNIVPASKLVKKADALIIVGTSMQVYPAAGLIDFLSTDNPIVFVDPHPSELPGYTWPVQYIKQPATTGVLEAFNWLKKYFKERQC